jgi:Lon protease-like protein
VELPLFPLNTVLCPGIAIPLHIFEERYRALIRDCLDGSTPFGIVRLREGIEVGPGAVALAAVGTIAEIRDVDRYDDGRFDLLVVGTRRFEIDSVRTSPSSYLVADVRVLDEEIGDEAAARRLAQAATRRFVTYLELLQPRAGETADEIDVRVEVETESEPEEEDPGEGTVVDDDSGSESPARRVVIPDDPTVLSHLLAGILQVELPRRQALLEEPTTETRLRSLLRLIEREVLLLRHRLRAFTPDPRLVGHRRS